MKQDESHSLDYKNLNHVQMHLHSWKSKLILHSEPCGHKSFPAGSSVGSMGRSWAPARNLYGEGRLSLGSGLEDLCWLWAELVRKGIDLAMHESLHLCLYLIKVNLQKLFNVVVGKWWPYLHRCQISRLFACSSILEWLWATGMTRPQKGKVAF